MNNKNLEVRLAIIGITTIAFAGMGCKFSERKKHL